MIAIAKPPSAPTSSACAALGDALREVNKLPVMQNLPKGVTVGQAGDAESLNELSEASPMRCATA